MENITSALTTALGEVGTNAMSVLAQILPAALTIVGAGMVIVLGVKHFKKIANK